MKKEMTFKNLTDKQWLELVCEFYQDEFPYEEITEKALIDYFCVEDNKKANTHMQTSIKIAARKHPEVIKKYNKQAL